MKERLMAVAFACGALVLFWMLIFPNPAPQGDEAPRPLSFETAPAGYAALWRWLEGDGVRVARLRRRFDHLDDPGLASSPTGNLLVITVPEAAAIRTAEIGALDAWVARGNTVLVIAALDDTPKWAVSGDAQLPERIGRIARMHVEPVEKGRPALAEAFRKPAAPGLVPEGTHPIGDGVTSLVTRGELESSEWDVTAADASPLLVLARRVDTNRPAIWLRAWGEGALVLSAWASPFANAQIGEGGNARWMSNVIRWAVAPQGTVLFDDMHQGASDYYDPQRFFADPRLHHTLWWIVGLWFAWVLGARPLLAARGARPPLDDTSMLRVTGGFLAHVLRPADAGRRLFALFFNDLRRRIGLPENGEPVWDYLAAHARIAPPQLDALRASYARAVDGRRVDLVRIQNSLLDITGRLS